VACHQGDSRHGNLHVERVKRPDLRDLLAAADPTRQDGAVALALLVLPRGSRPDLASRHYHLDGGTVAILVAASLGLPMLWVTWAAYRGPLINDPAAWA
jgi:hypothetical protein